MYISLTLKILLTFSIFFYSKSLCQNNKQPLLYNYNFNSKNIEIKKLPGELKEISGLAALNQYELLAHNDEEGIVYKLNIDSYSITDKIKIGNEKIMKDFEGIALSKSSIYIVTSSGTIYTIPINNTSSKNEYKKYNTFLDKNNDIEGMCYDESSNSLLLACKKNPGQGLKKVRAIYAFNLDRLFLEKKPRFIISLEKLNNEFNIKDFEPSGIEKNPMNGNCFVISANTEAIIELNSEGQIIGAQKLNAKIHKQPEGITFLNDGTMIISDEGQKTKPKLTKIKLED